MTKPEILNETPINMLELKKELERIKERDKELNFRAAKTEEYLNTFIKIKQKQAEDLYKEIENLQIPRLKPLHINKIIDLLPDNIDELKQILSGYTVSVNKEDIKKICDIVAKYKPQKK